MSSITPIRPCRECGGRRAYARASSEIYLFSPSMKPTRGISTSNDEVSFADALVCTECGMVTLIAQKPMNLLPR